MPFEDLAEEIAYRDPEWLEGSFWYFYRYRDQADVEYGARHVAVTKLQYDADEEKKARRLGKTYTGDMEQQIKMSGRMALIGSMSVRWEGEEFRYPANHRLRNGKPNPLAGQIPPCTYEHILNWPKVAQLRRIEDFLTNLYEGDGDAEEHATFQGGGSGVAGPDRGYAGNGKLDTAAGPEGAGGESGRDASVPEGSVGVPSDADVPSGLVG